MTDAAEDVLTEVNGRHRTCWRLQARLSGGYQSGAYLLTDPAGQPAVLKWSTDPGWAPTVLAAAPVIATAREQGWPTPTWLAVGQTTAGFPYQVQEYVEGTTQETVTHGWLDLVLPVIASQAGLGTGSMRDWSRDDHDVVFADRDSQQALVATSGPAGANLVEIIATIAGPHADVVLPSDDLVHGDLNPENVLIHHGQVTAFIDVEAVGRGTRLHDLTTLLLYAGLWGESEVLDRLTAECRTLAGPGHFEVSLSAVTLGLFAFGVRHWPSGDLAAACRTAATTLAQLVRSS